MLGSWETDSLQCIDTAAKKKLVSKAKYDSEEQEAEPLKLDSYLADICINADIFFSHTRPTEKSSGLFLSVVSFWVTLCAKHFMSLIPSTNFIYFEGVIPVSMLLVQRILCHIWWLCEDKLGAQEHLEVQDASLCEPLNGGVSPEPEMVSVNERVTYTWGFSCCSSLS